MKSVIVCGSVAIDLLGSYAGSFEQYQSQYPVRALNISLQLQRIETSFGGCGMNITYGLNLLGVDVIAVSAAGKDFNDRYKDHLESQGIDTQYIVVDEDYEHSAQCVIFSDQEGNQITAFNSGASQSPKRILPSQVRDIDKVGLAILAPEDAPIMLRQARDLSRFDIPMIFDPGQGIADFTSEEIRELLSLCGTVIANDHEWKIIQTISGLTDAQIKGTNDVIVTRGELGVDIYHKNEAPLHIDAVSSLEVIDPTGCGDAFRAGFVFGKLQDFTTTHAAQLGCIMAATNIGIPQTQHYKISPETLVERCKAYYS